MTAAAVATTLMALPPWQAGVHGEAVERARRPAGSLRDGACPGQGGDHEPPGRPSAGSRDVLASIAGSALKISPRLPAPTQASTVARLVPSSARDVAGR